MNQIKFGMFMKELRKRNGLTQEQVAERLNVSNRTVSRWETGTNMPDISLLIEIAKIYDVSIPELIDGEKKSEKINEETDEIARKMSDYAEAEKTTILRSVTKESLLGICALAVLTFLELLGSAARGWLFETAHLYCQVLHIASFVQDNSTDISCLDKSEHNHPYSESNTLLSFFPLLNGQTHPNRIWQTIGLSDYQGEDLCPASLQSYL